MRTKRFWPTGFTPRHWWRVLVIVPAVAALGTSWALAASITRVSLDSAGTQGNNDSYYPALSADGRLVAFSSWASNLVPGDTNDREDVFVHDRQTGTTTRVSLDSAGAQANGYSIAFALSADGRVVVFTSAADNLVPGDTNGVSDVFVYDYDPFVCHGFAATILGTPGDDVLVGTDGDDVIDGLDGNDIISGGGGHDVICGGPGDDLLRGGLGDDSLYGQDGRDRLHGDGDNDALDGGTDDDHLNGGDGSDVCDGGLQTLADTAAMTCETVVNVP